MVPCLSLIHICDSQEKAWEFIMYLIDHGAIGMYESGDRLPAKLTDQAEETIQSNADSKAFGAQRQNGEPMPTVSEICLLYTSRCV